MQPDSTHPPRKPGIDRKAAAAYLGISLSTIAHSAIPFTLRGKRAIYQIADLDRYDESRRREPAGKQGAHALLGDDRASA